MFNAESWLDLHWILWCLGCLRCLSVHAGDGQEVLGH